MEGEHYDVDVVFQTSTPMAICVRGDDEGRDVWLPRSLIRTRPKVNDMLRGDLVTVSAPEWLLEREGLV